MRARRGFTRSGSQPGMSWSSISTTVIRDPSASYTVAISSPMMPPPTTSRRVGHVGERERARRVDHPWVVEHRGDARRCRADGDDRVREGDRPRPVGGLHGQLVRRAEAPGAVHHLHRALLGQPGEALGEAGDDALGGAAQRVEVDRRLTEGDAELTRLLGLRQHARGVQQGLRRDAADVRCRRRPGASGSRRAPRAGRGRPRGRRPCSRPGPRRARRGRRGPSALTGASAAGRSGGA